jgi:hypothetical protein
MNHLSKEELLDHHFGESPGSVQRHLDGCAHCSRAFAALERDLREVGRMEPPEQDEAWARHVWYKLSPTLDPYPERRRGLLRGGFWPVLAYITACALLAAGAFYAGSQWQQRHEPVVAANPPAPAAPAASAAPAAPKPGRQHIVLVVLGDHLDRSERLLVELKHADAGSAAMVTPLRDEARTLLAANRACRQDARKFGDPALAAALDRLDRLLTQLANQPGGLNAATLSHLQTQMNAEGLLFEVRVLRSRIPATATRSKEGTI